MHLNNFLVSLVVVGVAIAAPAELAARQSCSNLQLVFLAGTSESGLGSVGKPLATALANAVSGTTSYGVPYDTSAEYSTTVAAGATMTENYISQQAARCPSQRFIIGGYSKGALVVHRVNLASNLKSKVVSITVFGDPALKYGGSSSWPINSPSVDFSPRDGSTATQNIASFCNSGDEFCDPRGNSIAPHLAYPRDGSIDVAAKFVAAKA